MACGYGCMKLLLFILITIQLVLGLVMMGGCIWALTDSGPPDMSTFASIIGSSLYNGSVTALIIINSVILIYCIIGYVGICRESRCALNTYAVAIIFQLLAMFGGAVAAIVLRAQIETLVVDGMKGTLKDTYGVVNSKVTEGWDTIQTQLECCGAKGDKADYSATDSWNAYRTSVNFIGNANGYLVPESCCVRNSTGYTDLSDCTGLTQNVASSPPVTVPPTATNPHLYMAGCYDAVFDAISAQALLVGIAGVFLTLVLVFAAVFACRIKQHEEFGGGTTV